MQAVAPKKGLAISLAKPLATFIQTSYHLDPNNYAKELNEMEELRANCIAAVPSLEAVACLARYSGQLDRMDSRFPLGEDGIKITFSWFNFAGKEKKPVASHDKRFEQACILFNIGAFYSQLATREGIRLAEGLKKACNHFLLAAGAFNAVATQNGSLQVPAGTDICEPTIRVLVNLMLAQAQECFVLKAILEKNVKDTTLAKLAFSTGLMYESCDCSEAVFTNYTEVVKSKAGYYRSMAHYYKSSEFLTTMQYGREIVKLQEAEETLKPVKSSTKRLPVEFQSQIENLELSITKNLERATKENSLIYHEAIPARGTWGDCGSAIVVKPTAFPDPTLAIEIQRPFIFDRLPMLHINSLVNELLSEREQLLGKQANDIATLLNSIEGLFNNLGLPGAIQAVMEPLGIPEGLISKSAEIQALGGFVALENGRETAKKLCGDCVESLERSNVAIKSEEEQDSSARTKYGSKWPRPLSSQLNCLLKERIIQVQKLLENANSTDARAEELYSQHLPMIISLCSSKVELEEAIPASIAQNTGVPPALITEIKDVLELRESFKKRGDQLLGSFKASLETVNILSRVYDLDGKSTFVKETVMNEISSNTASLKVSESIEQFGMEIGEFRRQVERLMADFQMACQSQIKASQERQTALQNLEEAYQAYKTLNNQIQAAIQFYSNLLDQLLPLEKVCIEFVENRQAEHDRLIESLENVPTLTMPPVVGNFSEAQMYPPSQYQPNQQAGNPSAYPINQPVIQPHWAHTGAAPSNQPQPQPQPQSQSQLPTQSYPPNQFQYYPGTGVVTTGPQPGIWNPNIPVQYFDNRQPTNVSPASYISSSTPLPTCFPTAEQQKHLNGPSNGGVMPPSYYPINYAPNYAYGAPGLVQAPQSQSQPPSSSSPHEQFQNYHHYPPQYHHQQHPPQNYRQG